MQPLLSVIFSSSTPGDRIPQFISPHPSFSSLSFSPLPSLALPASLKRRRREQKDEAVLNLPFFSPLQPFLFPSWQKNAAFLPWGFLSCQEFKIFVAFKKIILDIASVLRPWGWKCQVLPKWNTWQPSMALCDGRLNWGKRSQVPRVEGPLAISESDSGRGAVP